MSPAKTAQKRRRILIEVRPSWDERVKLWFHKLRHPRNRWLAWGSLPSLKFGRDTGPRSQPEPRDGREF